ncbi:MAG: hypothetical protein AAF927_20905 [Bacteroidota bacterium]
MNQWWRSWFFAPAENASAPSSLEQEVEFFQFRWQEGYQSLLPIQLMGGLLLMTYICGIVAWLFFDSMVTAQVCLWLGLLFFPFYFPAVFLSKSYWEMEQNTELELDHKANLIAYRNQDQYVLFHQDQIESCEIVQTEFMPYSLNYLCLRVKGGVEIVISSLIIDPETLSQHLAVKPVVKRRFFNAFPRLKVLQKVPQKAPKEA